MKKIISILIVIMMTLSIFACGGGTDDPQETFRRDDATKGPQGGTEAPGTGGASGIHDKPAVTFLALLQYAESGDTSVFEPHMLDASEKAQLKASVEAEGGTVDFGDDGSITVHGRNGSYFTITLNGSVEGVDDEGRPFGFDKGNKEWPASAFGKAVPKADFPIKMQVEDEESLMIMFENVTYAQAKAYGAKLREAGFSVEATELDMEDNGVYSFAGKNAAGLSVEFNYMITGGEPSCALSVGTPSEGGDTEPYVPEDPGTPTDLPAKFAFLLPEGQGEYKVYDKGGYASVTKAGGTLADAKIFASRCKSNGLTEQTTQEYETENGKKVFFASYVNSEKDEVHISYNEDEGTFYVDIIEYHEPEQPTGQDDWPTGGVVTKLPKPDFGTGFIVRDYGDQISITVTGGTAADFEGYVAKVKAKGFVNDAEYENEDDLLMYSAFDSEGYGAAVQFAGNTFGIVITTHPESYED